jgi:hypothetical protein
LSLEIFSSEVTNLSKMIYTQFAHCNYCGKFLEKLELQKFAGRWQAILSFSAAAYLGVIAEGELAC